MFSHVAALPSNPAQFAQMVDQGFVTDVQVRVNEQRVEVIFFSMANGSVNHLSFSALLTQTQIK